MNNNKICSGNISSNNKRRSEEVGVLSLDGNEIVSEIHRSITTKQRLSVLSRVRSILLLVPYSDPTYHQSLRCCHAEAKSLIQSGILDALILQLNYVLRRHGSTEQELELVGELIDALLRSGLDETGELISHEFVDHLIHLSSDLLARGVVYHGLSILHTLSATANGTTRILHSRKATFRVVKCFATSDDDEHSIIEALNLLKNLTFYGENFRRFLLDAPGLLENLIAMAYQPLLSEHTLVLLSSVQRNLALSLDCRRLLAQHPDVLNSLIEICLRYDHPKVIRNVLHTFMSLALDSDSCMLLVVHGDGVLLRILKQFIMNGTDSVVRKRAARILRILTNESTAPLIVHDLELIGLLSKSAIRDESSEVRREAAESFAHCATLVQVSEPPHAAILSILQEWATTSTVTPHALAAALKGQASHENQRHLIATKPELLEAIAHIALSAEVSNAAKEDVCCAMMYLSTEESVRDKLTSDLILDALINNASGRTSQRQEYAVRAIINIAAQEENRKKMANHANLLQMMVQVAASVPSESSVKVELKKSILQLVKEA